MAEVYTDAMVLKTPAYLDRFRGEWRPDGAGHATYPNKSAIYKWLRKLQRVGDLFDPDSWYWAAFQHAAGNGFWREWLRWQRLAAWQRQEIDEDIQEWSPPIPNHSADWPMGTGGLPLEPGISRSHYVRHRATGEIRRFYWSAEEGNWRPLNTGIWARHPKMLCLRQVHYSYVYVEPSDGDSQRRD